MDTVRMVCRLTEEKLEELKSLVATKVEVGATSQQIIVRS